MTDGDHRAPVELNTNVPHPARIYDYLLGGKANYAADRAVAEQVLAAMPDVALQARANRAFLARVVHHLTADHGIRQFLDIGTGLPAANNTHEVAQAIAPESRIVYVDNDPIVLVHAQALLTSTAQGTCAYLDCDLRDPHTILRKAADTLDLTQPVALLLIAVLHLIPDADDPWTIVRTLRDALPSGSFLAITHAASDAPMSAKAGTAFANANPDTLTQRTHADISRFFADWDILAPGVVTVTEWRPGPGAATKRMPGWVGVARKP